MSPSTERSAEQTPATERTIPRSAPTAIPDPLLAEATPIFEWEEVNPPPANTHNLTSSQSLRQQPGGHGFRWKNLSLRTKTALAAITLTTLSIAGIGLAADYFAGQAVSAQIQSGKQARANALARRLGMFMRERFRDTQSIAQAPFLNNPTLASLVTKEQKEQFLTNNLKNNGSIYSGIAFLDLQGNVLAQAEGSNQSNASNLSAFQQVIQTGEPTITNPEDIGGTIAASILVPVKDPNNQLIGVVQSVVPLKSLYDSVEDLATFGDEIHVIDAKGNFIFVSEKDQKLFGQSVETEFPGFMQRLAQKPMNSQFNFDAAKLQRLIAYKTQDEIPGLPEQLNWVGIVTLDGGVALKPNTDLRLTLIIGTLTAAVAVSALAIVLANRMTKPIVKAAKAVQSLGQGNLETRLDVPDSKDELAVLGSNINQMADQIQNLLKAQELAAEDQLAAQAEVAAQQLQATKVQQEARETLQNRAMQLLMEVAPLRQGDLTIRAQVTEDEIGTIADSYNATILSLRNLVSEVQSAATQVSGTAVESQTSIQLLSEDALSQADSIQSALSRLEQMMESIQNVAASAASAEQAVQAAGVTINAGDAAMNKTVSEILGLRETVAETAKKVQQLGQSSQEISKVVKLIGTFAAQTNLLALKASIEAARAGEEGRGFVVLADEVRALAQQSAKATEEIEQLVSSIQSETREVVQAMERGTQQVTTGSQRVEETRQTLTQIAQASQQISTLVQAINEAANFQSQTSQMVSSTMTNVAGTANTTSERANQVQSAFQDLLQVAGQLQTTVGQFKLS